VKAWAPDTLVVDCDPVRMRQVLDNLISNAIKYSPANSTVFVLGSWSGDTAQVQVIDHGHGMSPEDVRRVFEKFYRGATARMSTTPGLGIGLALSRAIIEQHRGTLTCHSTLGEGTVFTLTLPMTSAREAVPTDGPAAPSAVAGMGCLGAAAAPILIHLLSRRRHRETDWAAMRFLGEALRKNARRMRLEQWSFGPDEVGLAREHCGLGDGPDAHAHAQHEGCAEVDRDQRDRDEGCGEEDPSSQRHAR